MATKLIKHLLSEDRVHKAFRSMLSDKTLMVKDFRYEIIREDRYNEACAFMRDHFIPDEPLERSLETEWDEELEALTKTAVKEHLSLALVSESSGEIIAVRLCIAVKKSDVFGKDLVHEKLRKVLSLIAKLDDQCNIFDHYSVEEIIRFLALGVHRDFRRRGLGKKIMQAAVQFVKHLDLHGVVVKGEGTSNYSKRIYEQLKFDTLAEIEYAKYEVDGEVVFKHMGDHKSVKLYGTIIR